MTLTILRDRAGRAISIPHLSVEVIESNYITQHPIENGVSVSDHSQRQPGEIVARLLASPASLEAGASPTIREDARRFFDQASGKRLSLTFNGLTYAGYGLATWRTVYDKMEAGVINCTFKLIRIARAVSVRIPAGNTNNASAPDTQDLGSVNGQETPPSEIYRTLVGG